MKAFLFAGLAVVLAGSSLQAQEPSTLPRDVSAQDDQSTQKALVQQLLRLEAQTGSGGQPAATGSAQTPNDQATENSLVQQLVRLATQEITLLQQKLKEFDGDSPASEAAPTAPADPAGTAAAPLAQDRSSDDSTVARLAHAWDSSLSTGGLQTGGLQTGGLTTGSLQTGTLHSGGLLSSHQGSAPTANAGLPSRNFLIAAITGPSTAPANTPPATPPAPPVAPLAPAAPTASSLPPANAPAVNAPPGDPDEAMYHWSRKMDRIYSSESVARRAALRLYPALAVSHSAFNTQFLARYKQYRQSDPFGFLRGPGWPMKLAILTAGDLQRQRGNAAF